MTIDLDALREGWDFEGKLAAGKDGRGEVPRSFWETYCAMANTRGGVIVLGVKQRKDGNFEATGIVDADRVETDLWNTLWNPSKVSVNLLDEGSVARERLGSLVVIVIRVPRADRRRRPVYLNGNPLRGTYVRSHEGDRLLDEAGVKRMLADADERPNDAMPLERFTLADLDDGTVVAYRNVFRSNAPDHPFLAENDTEMLRQLGGLRWNRETGRDEITEAALLMFGRWSAIQEHLPNWKLDFREIARDSADDGSSPRWIDRVVPDGTWSGNLFSFYRRVMPKLTDGLKVPFRVSPDLTRQDETRVHQALREALVNALVHADFRGKGGVRVFRHPDRYELYNPGTLLLPLEQVRRGGKSECRNPTLQHMFRMVGIGEQAGSGVPSILRAWRERHWRLPALTEDIQEGETRLELRMLSLFPPETLEELRSRFGDKLDALGEDGRIAVATAATDGQVTNRRLQDLTESHPRDLTFLLRGLVEDGFLEAFGERQLRRYTLPSAHAAASPPQSLQQSSQQREASLPHNTPWDPDKILETLRKVAGKKWSRQEDIQAAILAVCRGAHRTVGDIATALKRSEGTVRNHYLPPLVQSGRLALRYPDTPSHPSQAYRTAEVLEEA